MKSRFAPVLPLLLFPALHAQEQPDISPVARIEQTVIAREAETSAAAMRDLAMTLPRATTPEEKRRLQLTIGKYAIWMKDLDSQLQSTGAISEDAAETLSGCAPVINEVAWHLVTQQDFSAIPHELPRSLAEVAVKWIAADSDDRPALLDTYARTLAVNGAMDQAVAQEQLAVKAGEDDEERAKSFQATLDSYRKGVIPAVENAGEWNGADPADDIATAQPAEVEVEAADAGDDDAEVEKLNKIAWGMLASPRQMPEAALPVAVAAMDHCKLGLQQARVLDTCARALFMNGKEEAAVKLQEKALAGLDESSAGDDGEKAKALRESLTRTLGFYREGVLPEPNPLERPSQPDSRQDASTLNEYAWNLVTADNVDEEAARTAAGIATAALAWNDDEGSLRPAILDTLARAQFLSGKHAEALATQKEAVSCARERSLGESWVRIFNFHLSHYEKGELPGIGE